MLHLRSYYLKTLIQARIFYLVLHGAINDNSRLYYPVYFQSFWSDSFSLLSQKNSDRLASAAFPSVESFLIVREESDHGLSSLSGSMFLMSLEGSPQL